MARPVLIMATMALLLAVATTAATYDPVEALRGIHYVKASKCAPDHIAAWDCGVACTNFSAGSIRNVTVIYKDSDETQLFIAYNSADHEIAIAFRGSTTILNWLEDAEVTLVPYAPCNASSDCRVHFGFYSTYTQVQPQITAAVQALLAAYPGASIHVSGHSLGAAQAQLCALDMTTTFGPQGVAVHAYQYGCPRVGNPAFVAYAEATLQHGNHFHVTHDADPVPHLPPISWGYLHVPREVWYKQGINALGFKVCHGNITHEDPTCADSVALPIDIEDHLYYLDVYTGCHDSSSDSRAAKLALNSQLERHNKRRSHQRS